MADASGNHPSAAAGRDAFQAGRDLHVHFALQDLSALQRPETDAAGNGLTGSIEVFANAAKSVISLSDLISVLHRVVQIMSSRVDNLAAERDALQADLRARADLTTELQETRASLRGTNERLAAAVRSQQELERRLSEAERKRTEAERLRAAAEEKLAQERVRLAEFEQRGPTPGEQGSSARAADEPEPIMGEADQQAVRMVLERADRLLREQEGNLRQWRQTMGEPASRQETSSTATASADSVPVDGRLVTPATTSGTSDQEKAEPPGPVKRGHGGATVGVDGAGPATSDAELRAAIVNVARDYLRLAKTRTHAQVEALIWGDTSSDSADFVPSDIAFAKLTLELAAQATGLRSWAAGRATYPWPLPMWADVRVDTNPASPVFASMVAHAREHGRWHPLGDGYQPQPGDWALYDEHIAVVTRYADGVLDTIGADSRPDLTVRAHCSSAPLAEQGVTGFIDNGSLKPTSGSPGMPAQHAPAATRRVADADVAAKVVSQLEPYGRQVHKARPERLYEQQLPARVHTAFFACAHTPIRRMEPMYKDIARQAGISWELLAACDWMQCHSKLDLSPVHGERLGRLNADGTSYSTKSAALTQCAREFTDLSAMVYGIDLTTRRALSVWDLAAAFAAFGWGMILRRHGVSPMEFPYSVAGLTALHQKMHWPYIDAPESPNRPGARFREPFGAVPVVLRLGYPATV